DGWTGTGAALVGQGVALLVYARGAWYQPAYELQTGHPLNVLLQNSTSGGQCADTSPSANTGVSSSWLARANFWSWNAATATNAACVLGGSMLLERFAATQAGVPDRVKITLNVQFNDGTVWQDLVFWADHRTD